MQGKPVYFGVITEECLGCGQSVAAAALLPAEDHHLRSLREQRGAWGCDHNVIIIGALSDSTRIVCEVYFTHSCSCRSPVTIESYSE